MKFLFLALGAALCMTACNGSNAITARDNDNPGNNKPADEKPDETVTGTVVEKLKALQFQEPTLTESEFLNTMDLEFGDNARAFFSFTYAPSENGSLYFSLAQLRLHLNGCTKEEKRNAKVNVFWQEVSGTKRKIVGSLKDSIQEFEFSQGQQYVLSYVLSDLKKDFSDCKGATLKFATFRKDFKLSK